MISAQPAEVLLVEDSPFDAELTLLAFDHLHVSDRVLVVQDGEEALEYLFAEGRYRDRPGKHGPKVVLLDLKMPRVDGFEVLHAIKSDPRTRLVPVVLLTSSAQDRDVARGYELGANSFIVKPVDFSAFAEAIRSVGTYWLHLNQSPGS
jgi:CheY-like chemotaxis protein